MSSIADLQESVRGEVITPDHESYDEARVVYNAMHDRRPAAVVPCVDAADVLATIAFAADQSLDLAVRGGGIGLFVGCAAGDTSAAVVLQVGR